MLIWHVLVALLLPHVVAVMSFLVVCQTVRHLQLEHVHKTLILRLYDCLSVEAEAAQQQQQQKA